MKAPDSSGVGNPTGQSYPLVPLRDLVFFPEMVVPLLIGRPRSVAALEEARKGDGRLVVVAQRDPDVEEPAAADLYRVGTLVQVVEVSTLDDGTARVVLDGIERVRVRRFHSTDHFHRARTDPLRPSSPDPAKQAEVEALLRRVEKLFGEYIRLHDHLDPEAGDRMLRRSDPQGTLERVAGHLLAPVEDKQELLAAESLLSGLETLQSLLDRELEILRIEADLDERIRDRMDRDRRHFYLQEQLKAIHEELGEDSADDWGEIREALARTPLPPHVRERAERELGRLRKLTPAAPEAAVIRTYLDWILSLPWERKTQDAPDLAAAEELLEAEHHGLDEVKDRILDHMAVLSMVGELQGPILCLVGPPGVGKTSLGRSIARALGRDFVRVSLGGVRDEAEIRGHRRTYVGALPGRILQGMRRSGSRNPVFLLDEVDKLSRDVHGDPGSALLEVLDPEQNHTFTDHYLELDFDLSDVLFVATANTLAEIPEALKDRMEVIRIPGYLDSEKRAIARRFLIPEQLRRNGVPDGTVRLSDEAIQHLIEAYTREAGVRELDRSVAKLARKLARRLVSEQRPATSFPESLGPAEVEELMGPPSFRPSGPGSVEERVGVANGLAWTPAGGQILEVEVVVVPGTGKIQLTGTLGDVMKESAVAALTFARSRSRKLELANQFHRDMDVHIHIPEGATPKDGPSAGAAIAAALVSALTGRPTRDDVALTGEITLRGRVLPVGGIREKTVAAVRGGIRTVVIPSENESELEELPDEVRQRLEFVRAGSVDEVLEAALKAHPGLALEGEGGRDRPGEWSGPGMHLSQ